MKSVLAIVALSFALHAQTTTTPRPFVRAAGQASVFVQPDQVKIDATITTQGNTAQDAAAQNATVSAAVVTALQKLLGANADIKTVNYFISPIYRNSTTGGPPTIVGYTANNTVQVTLSQISQAGAVIDTAAGAGASSIGSLQFSLKDPEPSRLQALKLATIQAKNHADAIAGGIGRVTGAIISVEEGSAVRVPVVGMTGAAPTMAATQVTPGLIDVQANVVLQAELN